MKPKQKVTVDRNRRWASLFRSPSAEHVKSHVSHGDLNDGVAQRSSDEKKSP